tara:strand:+ start:1898 stop:2545 length:648 start_codon:yes stop_codon:yes gene_type:complete
MNLELNNIECRVFGCMIEKSITTPEYYPLSLNSLVNACNQKSNRHPVINLDDSEVLDALDELRGNHLCFRVDTAGSRVPKFKYATPENWEFSGKHLAIISELLIRGPQTPGELRSRGDRMYSFLDLDEVESTLESLQSHEEGPFVEKLPVQPGKKEARFAQLLGGTQEVEGIGVAECREVLEKNRIEELENEMETLKAEIQNLQSAFAKFKEQFD